MTADKPVSKPAPEKSKTTAEKPAKAPAAKPAAVKKPVSPGSTPASKAQPARNFKFKARHIYLVLSFICFVVLPFAGAQYYFNVHAKPQYASSVGFVVRQADSVGQPDVLGGLARLTGSTSNDTDILYEFIYSQELVKRVDRRLDLRNVYNKVDDDPVFTLGDAPEIEALVRFWARMVRVTYDANTGLLEARVLAFTPEDAQNIAQAILDESSLKINDLSATARADAIRYAQATLDKSAENLRDARQALTEFRNTNQIIDPAVTLQERSGLLNSLQQQLAKATIDYNLLDSATQVSDPRLAQSRQRIAEIQSLIEAEKEKIGQGENGQSADVFSALFSRYERLTAEREFAEQRYVLALQSYDNALSLVDRQSRYLSPYILPTLAESAQFPQRWVLSGILLLFLFFTWAVFVLVVYSLRDRK